MSRTSALGRFETVVTGDSDNFRVTFRCDAPTVACSSGRYRSGSLRQDKARMNAARRQAIHEAMVRLSDGDRTAFDVLLDELWPVVLSFAERGVGRGMDAEDVAQEAFYKVCARIADFDRDRDAVSWVFGIASYEIMSLRRKQKRRRELFDEALVAEQLDGAALQEEQLIARELTLAFQEAVGVLTEEDRLALGLVAGTANADGATLRKRKQRALDRLRGIWRQIYGAP